MNQILLRILCLLCLSTSFTVFAQETPKDSTKSKPSTTNFTTDQSDALRNFQPKVVKASPEATAFHQISQMPLSHYTGKTQISIPLLGLESRHMALPLNLSYDPSGIRVEQEATQVGLGWSLSGGLGMITRVVKGRDDFDGMFRTWFKEQNTLNKFRANSFDISPTAGNVKWQYDNFLIQYGSSGQNLQTQLSLFCTTSTTDSVYIISKMMLPATGALQAGKPSLDGESDIYNFQAGSYSGRFIFQVQGTGFQVVMLDQSPVKIELLPSMGNGLPDYTGESGFKITTPDGMKYYYTLSEKTKARGGESLTGKLVYVEKNSTTDPVYAASSVGWDVINVDAAIPQITGWYLTKMESPDDATDFIQLDYTQDSDYSAITLPNRIQNLVVNSAKWRLSDTRQKLLNLSSITSPKGSITFKRSSRLDLRGAMATKIDTIILKDQFNRTVSRFKFNYGYFDSGTTAEEFVRKRLKLLGIEQLANDGLSTIPTHTFAYNEQAPDGTALCDKNSYMQDFWGFFNHATQNDIAINAAYGSGSGTINPVLNGTMIPVNIPSNITIWGFTNPANRNANFTYCQIGSLSSITYPTGGVTVIDYELHDFQNYAIDALPNSITVSNNSSQNSTKISGVGLRTAQTKLYETATATNYLAKKYAYTQTDNISSSGKLMFDLKFSQIINNGTGNPYLLFTSQSVYPNNHSANGNPIGYDRVVETDVNPADNSSKGKVVYEFINKVEQRKDRFCLQFKSNGTPYTCADATPQSFPGYCSGYTLVNDNRAVFYNQSIYENASIPNYSHLDNGLMSLKTIYNKAGFRLMSEANSYGEITYTERIRVKNLSVVGRETTDFYPAVFTYWTDAEWIKLVQKTTTEYINNEADFLTQTETYGYHPVTHLVNSVSTINSKNETLLSTTTFANDLASGTNIYQKMVNLNKLTIPIETLVQNTTLGITIQKIVYGFKEFTTNQILPETIQNYVGGQNPNRNEAVLDYDIYGNVQTITPINAPEQRFIWGYGGNYPIAEVKNAKAEKIFYNSFEDNGTVAGNWKLASSLRTQNNAHTGTQFYNLTNGNIQTGTAAAELLNASMIYTLSYWANGSGAYSVNGNATPTKTGLTVGGWTYYEHTITGVTSVQIQGNGGIDELRMYPQTAFMTSFTENLLVGLSALSDVNGYKMSYQFDGFQRLKMIQDPQNYVLKDIFYHYANQTALTGLGVTPTNAQNYIISRTAREAQTALDSDVDKTQTQLQYSDGLGRGLEGILWKGSPDKTKDILTGLSLFDAYGRGYKGILMTSSDVSTGAYRSNAETLANTFYADTAAHTRTVFETSPLNRVEKQYGAGQAWRVADKYVKIQYLLAGIGILQFSVQPNGSVSCGTSYTVSTLFNHCTETERGSQIYELKDKEGRVTHKFQQMDNGFAVTGYCYNSLGFLSYVIPPEAYKKMGTGTGLISSFTENDEIFKELCFGYHQDKYGRQIEKHVPGGGWEFSIFNRRDQKVMFADEADLAKGYWRFNQFDNLFRIVRKGIRTGMGSVSRATLQTAFDAMTETYEERGTTLLGYTNRSFPTAYQIADADVRMVFYYDDFLWNSDVNYGFQVANAYHAQGFNKGMVTGKLVRNLKTIMWQKMLMCYDYRGKIIQDFHFTNKGNLIRKDYQYRFNGELLKLRIEKKNSSNVVLSTKIITYQYDHLGRKISYAHNGKPIVKIFYDAIGRLTIKKFSPSGTTQGSKQTGNWTDASNWLSGILPTLADNVTINTGQTLTIPTGEKAYAGTLNDKGTLKNFGTLNMGKITTADLYIQSFSHHIRGGLRGINLDANGDLTNALFSLKIEYEGNNGFFDGNIRNQYWKSSIDGVQRAYEYNYDKASRLISGAYGRTPQASENYTLNNVSYDFNGNITNLSRNGLKSDNSFGLIDNLNYTYNTNSNKILKVDDASVENASFKDVTGNDYTYRLDGSLKSDNNKGIDSIQYNYLKLPQKIFLTSSRWIEYEYDAEGMKLKKTLSTGKYTDYEEDEIYENGILYQTTHDEGRTINGVYEYNITDHLGNFRVAFKDSSGIAKITQVNHVGAWGETLESLTYTNTPKVNNFTVSAYEKENDFGINVFDARARVYDAITPRFWQQDILADEFSRFSPYNYAVGNPLRYIDPSGMAVESIAGGVRFTGADAGEAFSVLRGQKRNVLVDITKEKDATTATGRVNYDNWAVFSVSNLGLAYEALNSFNKGSIKNLVLGSHGISVTDLETHSQLVGLRFKTDDIRNEGFLIDDIEKYNKNGSVLGNNRGESLGITVLKNILEKVEVGGNCIFAVCYLGASQNGIGKGFATQLSTLSENKLTLYTYTDGAAVWHFKDGEYKGAIGIGGDARLEAKGSPTSAHWNVIQNGNSVKTISQIILSDSSNPVIFKK